MLNIWILKRRFDYYRGVFLLGKGRLTFIRSKLMIKEEPGGGNCDERKKIYYLSKTQHALFGVLIPIVAINLIMNQIANVRIQQQGAEKMEVQLASKVINFDKELSRINAGLRFHVLNGEEAFLATNYYSLSSYQLGQKVAQLNARLNELSLISDCIEDVAVFMPHIERVVSFLNYYDDNISEMIWNVFQIIDIKITEIYIVTGNYLFIWLRRRAMMWPRCISWKRHCQIIKF